jgi:hypothetical protein
MLTVLAQDAPKIQTFIITKLVKETDFTKRIYLSPQTSSFKVDRVKELARKIILANSVARADRAQFELDLESEYERLNLHLSIIQLLSKCCTNFFVTKQLRN